jgi:hypothetical protein
VPEKKTQDFADVIVIMNKPGIQQISEDTGIEIYT